MSFDSDVLEVWLDELTADPEPVQEVCEFHAERLTAPRGWTVSDRRAPRPAGEVLPSGRPPATVAGAPQPVATAPVVSAPAPPVAEHPPAELPEPAPAASAPEGSLLARAFRSTGRRSESSDESVPSDPGAAPQ
jgi:hypothetical protein